MTINKIRDRVDQDFVLLEKGPIIIERDLRRYYNLLDRVQYDLFHQEGKAFNYDEAFVLTEILSNAVINFDIDPCYFLKSKLKDFLISKPEKVENLVDGKVAFVDKIKALSKLECAYLIDAIERFWIEYSDSVNSLNAAAFLLDCGLVSEQSYKDFVLAIAKENIKTKKTI